MWSDIWSVATTRIDFQTWISSTRLVDWDRKSLVDSILEKLNLFCLTGLITLALLMWKWMGLFLRRNLLRCWGCLSHLNWIGALTLSLLLRLLPRNWSLEASSWGCSCLYKSTIRSYMDYCHTWAGAPSFYLELLYKLQKPLCRTVAPSLVASFEPLTNRRNLASLSLFDRQV